MENTYEAAHTVLRAKFPSCCKQAEPLGVVPRVRELQATCQHPRRAPCCGAPQPENFLLTAKGPEGELKLTDFGLGVFFRPGERFRDLVGSPYYGEQWANTSPDTLLPGT